MSVNHSLTQATLAYQPGDVIAGKYALEALLGSGGMGAVFRARNTLIDMPVAIKLIRADLDREQFSGRLLQEARAAAKLAHPAIVRVFDVGQTALGDPFIVMELLEGETLTELVEREGPLTSERALQLLLPIADGLAIAHSKGFVHRDVKPDNVFISRSAEGHVQPKLVDFGIVKRDDLSGEPQTQAGHVVGSPDYMSPEQARGQANVDLRSDVWSFCVVVYEAVTGHPPFEAENYNALMRLIVETEPPTLHDLGATDGALSAIIAKGLTKDVSERWSSLGLLGKALATWLYEQGIGEDACGASLEARWLARPTDPSPGRFSSSVPPFNRLEPRTGSRDRIASAPTIVSRSAGTPHSLSQTQERGSSRSRRALTVLGIVAAGVTAYAALRPTPSGPPHSGVAPETVRLGVAPSSPGLASPEPPPSATATLSAAPAPAIAASAPSAEPGRPGSPHARKLQPAAPPPPLPAAPAPVPTPAPPAPTGASDLLSPY